MSTPFPPLINVSPPTKFHKQCSPYHIMAKYYHDVITANQLICIGSETGGEAGAEEYKTHRQTRAHRGWQPCEE